MQIRGKTANIDNREVASSSEWTISDHARFESITYLRLFNQLKRLVQTSGYYDNDWKQINFLIGDRFTITRALLVNGTLNKLAHL